ncbi:hypothetical protein [Haloglomus litoreum]|uniref:hypothetical protein n=1 Tax=Haloglomus litoreum TaxID=3034026 RepID=UPI0023E8ECC9|nr:hypothetical protein [Haloglomus sp. DT116]
MGTEPRDVGDFEGVEPAAHPVVPEGVLRGINDLAAGRTVSNAELDDSLKF